MIGLFWCVHIYFHFNSVELSCVCVCETVCTSVVMASASGSCGNFYAIFPRCGTKPGGNKHQAISWHKISNCNTVRHMWIHQYRSAISTGDRTISTNPYTVIATQFDTREKNQYRSAISTGDRTISTNTYTGIESRNDLPGFCTKSISTSCSISKRLPSMWRGHWSILWA